MAAVLFRYYPSCQDKGYELSVLFHVVWLWLRGTNVLFVAICLLPGIAFSWTWGASTQTHHGAWGVRKVSRARQMVVDLWVHTFVTHQGPPRKTSNNSSLKICVSACNYFLELIPHDIACILIYTYVILTEKCGHVAARCIIWIM